MKQTQLKSYKYSNQTFNSYTTNSILKIPFIYRNGKIKTIQWHKTINQKTQQLTHNFNRYTYQCSLLDLSYSIQAIIYDFQQVTTKITFGQISMDKNQGIIDNKICKMSVNCVFQSQNLTLGGNKCYKINLILSDTIILQHKQQYFLQQNELESIHVGYRMKNTIVIQQLTITKIFRKLFLQQTLNENPIKLQTNSQQQFSAFLFHINQKNIKNSLVISNPFNILQYKPILTIFDDLMSNKKLRYSLVQQNVDSQLYPQIVHQPKHRSGIMQPSEYFDEFQSTLFPQSQNQQEMLCLNDSFEKFEKTRDRRKEEMLLLSIKIKKQKKALIAKSIQYYQKKVKYLCKLNTRASQKIQNFNKSQGRQIQSEKYLTLLIETSKELSKFTKKFKPKPIKQSMVFFSDKKSQIPQFNQYKNLKSYCNDLQKMSLSDPIKLKSPSLKKLGSFKKFISCHMLTPANFLPYLF